MSAVEVTISGVLYDKVNRTTQNVVLIGEAFLTGLGVGGGPIIPPPGPGGPVDPGYGKPTPPDVIWGGRPPPGGGSWVPPQPGDPHPSHPIALPGDPWWPTDPPPTIPPPGSPPVVLPGLKPVNPIVPPPCIIVDYPGIGKVLVPQPAPPVT